MFTQTWFEDLAKHNFEKIKIEYHPISFLEIGCYEGNCHLYMYQTILTHPESRSTVIDPFGRGTGSSLHENKLELFKHNLKDYLSRIIIYNNLTNEILPTLTDMYDIIYVDGDHSAVQTYIDGIHGWKLLKKDGIMIFDDYKWHGVRKQHTWPQGMAIGEYNHPAKGVNNFLKQIEGEYTLFGKKDGFDLDCKIIDLNRLEEDEYIKELETYNYQIWIKKIV